MKTATRYWLLGLLLATASRLLAQSNAPTSLTGTAPAYNQVVLTWKDNSTGETKFEIERNNFTTFAKIGEVAGNITTYTDNTAGGGTYRVRAILATGAPTAYSNEFTISTPPEPPATPTGLVATAESSNSIKLTWNNGSGGTPTDYQVERGTSSGGPFNLLQTVAYSRAPTFTDNGAVGGTQYCYRIRARNTGGSSNYTAAVCATPPLAPTSVSNLKATAINSSSIRLNWDPYGKEISLSIERRTGQTGSWARVGAASSDGGTYTDNGLSGSTEYCYRVGEDGHNYSGIACATTSASVPNAPARLTATAISTSQINLQWADLSDNETGFQIERGSSTAGTFTKIADVAANTTTFSDQNLTASTPYCYRVRAVNSAGASGYTDVQCATTPAPPVGAPQNLVATAASTTQINLTWTGVSGATTYQLERSPNGNDSWTRIADPAGSATSYSDPNLTANTRYYYRIRAVISSTAGPYSNAANAITPDAPPAAPARLTATAASFSQISLSWADLSANESGFQLERSPSGTDNWTKIADIGPNITTYSDQNLSPQTRYYYRIRATNAAGNSDYSNVTDATTPVGPPAAPQSLSAVATSTTQISLSWNTVATATNVLIERSPNGNDSWSQLGSVAGSTTTYDDQGLNQNTRYYYRIRGTNASGNGPYSNVANAITPDAPPAAPARLTATAASFSQISLSWADLSANESGFQLERSPNGTDNWTKIADVLANVTTYSDQNLSPRTRYYYRVRAVNAAGNSGYSNVADATTPDTPPAAPTRLTATAASNTQINLSWTDGSDNETGFELERSPDGTTWTKLVDLPTNATTYQNTGLTPNVRYYYRVRAVNAVGQSAYSNVADVTTPDVSPAAPARLTATATSPTQVTLAWADLSNNESGFEIERGSSATATFAKIADVAANTMTYINQNLADNTAYCYRVRAKNAAGNSAYTDVVCVTTPLAPPAAPTNLTAQVFDYDQIQLNWSLPGTSTTMVLIERSTSPTSGFVEIGQRPASQPSYVDAGLQEYTTYYYRIRATNAAGNSGYSNVASARVEDVIIAIEDEFIAQTTLIVHNQALTINTNWQRRTDASIQLLSMSGQEILVDQRRVRPEDSWQYPLNARPAGVYIVRIVADGRVFAKRFLLP